MEIGREVMFKDIAMLGVKNADQAELKFIRENNIFIKNVWDIERQGIDKTLKAAIEYLLDRNKKIYVSLDLDVIDVEYAPGVGTPTHGGITYREILYLSRALSQLFNSKILCGLDVVELNPSKDKNKKTVSLAIELIMSVLGYEYGPFAIFRDNRGPI
jgi:arginase